MILKYHKIQPNYFEKLAIIGKNSENYYQGKFGAVSSEYGKSENSRIFQFQRKSQRIHPSRMIFTISAKNGRFKKSRNSAYPRKKDVRGDPIIRFSSEFM